MKVVLGCPGGLLARSSHATESGLGVGEAAWNHTRATVG